MLRLVAKRVGSSIFSTFGYVYPNIVKLMYKALFRETFEPREETITVERGGCRPSRIRCFRLWVQKLRTSSGVLKKDLFFPSLAAVYGILSRWL